MSLFSEAPAQRKSTAQRQDASHAMDGHHASRKLDCQRASPRKLLFPVR